MTEYNTNFLIAAMVILLMILWHFCTQKRSDDLNNRAFLLFVILGILDVAFEILSTFYITSGFGDYGIGAWTTTTVFYLMQALLPFGLICYIRTLHENKVISPKSMFLMGLPTMILLCVILTNPFTGALFCFEASAGYIKGPHYMLMYYCALFHILFALCQIILWRKSLGNVKIKVMIEIIFLAAGGVVIQGVMHPLLTTGFGLSLGMLAMFVTINHPYANTDNLTGLYDKTYLVRKLDEMIAARKNFHVISVYVYQVGQINKAAGMQSGDEVLCRTAESLQIIGGEKVFRISGKRFLMLANSLAEYENFLLQMKQNDAYPAVISGILHAEKLKDSGEILAYAEYLESQAPQSGTTEIVQDDSISMQGYLYHKQVEQFLHTAIDQDLFEIHYQPVYSMQENRFITLEALSRLHHPDLGWIPPDLFIRIAEKNRMINRITDLQLRRVCAFLKNNEKELANLRNVKVNLSAIDLIQPDAAEHFIRILDEYEIPHTKIQFEITETMATEYSASLYKVAEKLVRAGICLCLDDFGSGYANLNSVTQLPFSAIKLDRSLLFHISGDKKTATFYQSIVDAFQRMGYSVISEGVETEEEMQLLSGWGVDMIQGYYFSKPLPPEGILSLIITEAVGRNG